MNPHSSPPFSCFPIWVVNVPKQKDYLPMYMQQNRGWIWTGASDLCHFISNHIHLHLFLTIVNLLAACWAKLWLVLAWDAQKSEAVCCWELLWLLVEQRLAMSLRQTRLQVLSQQEDSLRGKSEGATSFQEYRWGLDLTSIILLFLRQPEHVIFKPGAG